MVEKLCKVKCEDNVGNLQEEEKSKLIGSGGSPVLQKIYTLPLASRARILIGDANNDGKNELVILSHNKVSVYKFNSGSGQFDKLWEKKDFNYLPTGFLGDTDNDGDEELLIRDSQYNGGTVYIFEHQDGTWVQVWSHSRYSQEDPWHSWVGDSDNDGNNEIILGSGYGGRNIEIYRYNGSGSYDQIWSQYLGKDVYTVQTVDVDNDNLNELLVGDGLWSPDVRLYEYNGSSYDVVWNYSIGQNVGYMARGGDLDNDGANEILVAIQKGWGSTNGVRIFKQQSEHNYSLVWSIDENKTVSYPVINDIFNNGQNQFVYGMGDSVKIYQYNGINFENVQNISSISAIDIKVGDVFNCDKNVLAIVGLDSTLYFYCTDPIQTVNQLPVVTSVSPSSGQHKDTIILSATSNDPDGDTIIKEKYQYSLNGSTNWLDIGEDDTPNDGYSWTSGLNEATVWIRAKAYDGKEWGNWFTGQGSFMIDNTPPVFSNWSTDPATLTVNSTGGFTVSLDITDDLSGIPTNTPFLAYHIGSEPYSTYQPMTNTSGNTWSFTIPEPSGGWSGHGGDTLYYKVKCEDNVGNLQEEEKSKLITADNQIVFEDDFDSYPNWAYSSSSDFTSFPDMGPWVVGDSTFPTYLTNYHYHHYVNIIDGIITGIGSGYSSDSNYEYPRGKINAPISLDGTQGFAVEFYGRSSSNWPDATTVYLLSGYEDGPNKNLMTVSNYGFRLYGESSTYAIDIVKTGLDSQYTHLYRYPVGENVLGNWHVWRFERNGSGEWTLYKDGNIVADFVPTPDTELNTFNRVYIDLCRGGSQIDWLKIYGLQSQSPPGNNIVSGQVNSSVGPLGDATVQAWSSYPDGTLLAEVHTDNTGAFSFSTLSEENYDIRAYASGYYPNILENIACPSSENTITLEAVPSVLTSSTNCDYWGTASQFHGQLFQPGDIVTAMDPDGVTCGVTQVTTKGAYTIHVNGDDQTTPDIDEGANINDHIRFFVNKVQARVKTGTNVWKNLGSIHAELEAPPQGHKIILYPNWNLVSFNVFPFDSTVSTLINPLGDKISNICGYIAGGFKTWDKNRPSFLNDLAVLSPEYGYWIRSVSTQVETLDVSGSLCIPDMSISLLSNWNLISYLPEVGDSLGHALSSLGNDYLFVGGYEGASGGFKTWDRKRPSFLNDLQILKPGHGYWIKMASSGTLNYPTSGYKATGILAKAVVSLEKVNGLSVVYTPYCCDLWGIDQEILSHGDIIEVYDQDGIRCGAGIVNSRSSFLIHVYGDDPSTKVDEGPQQSEKLTLYLNGSPISTEKDVIWKDRESERIVFPNKIKDSVLPKNYRLFQNYPNPFNPETTIQYDIPKLSRIKINIFNLKGAIVRTLFDGERQPGTYYVVWDGKDELGRTVSSGIYFVVLDCNETRLVKKLTFLK